MGEAGTYPDLELVASQTANWSQAEAQGVMESMLQATPDIKDVISGSNAIAMGARAALEVAGHADAIIVGFSGTTDLRDPVLACAIKATVRKPAYAPAQMAVEQAERYLKTGSTGLDEKQLMDCVQIDETNAAKLETLALVE